MAPGLGALRADWDDLAIVDPLWAILSEPSKRHGAWSIEEFLRTGETDIDAVLAVLERHGALRARGSALDWGCGVGRLTRALSGRFELAIGLDLSEQMVSRARELQQDRLNVEFRVADGLAPAFERDVVFDLVISLLVLQHYPSTRLAAATADALARRVRPGGALVLQVPRPVPMRHRLQPRRRLYAILRRLGVSNRALQCRIGLSPIRMLGLDQAEMERILESAGMRILEVHSAIISGTSIESLTYFAARRG